MILVLVIVLVVFGPGRLPEIGNGLGKSLREFKESMSGLSNAGSALPAREGPEQAPSSRHCSGCGVENAAENEFCGKCGKRLSEGQ